MKNWLIKKLGGHIESDIEILRDRIINDVLDNPTMYKLAREYKKGVREQASKPVISDKIAFGKLKDSSDKNNILSQEEE